MYKTFLTGMTLIVLLAVVYGCSDNNGVITDEDGSFVTINYGLEVTTEWDHYPALNESANVSITFKCKEWFRDSLLSLGIDSIELGPIFYVDENSDPAYNAFFPQSGTLLWSESVSIYDTINWDFDLKPLREGKFDVKIIIEPPGDWENLFIEARASDDICIYVEENQGYLCPEQPPTNGGSGGIIVDPVPDTAQ